MIKNIVLYIILVCCTSVNSATNYNFNKLTIDEGLIHNNITCIKKDQRGFMWFGTHGGISCYNGTQFKNYLFNPLDSTALISNRIQSLEVDPSGTVWIGGNKGFQKYNFNKDEFELQKYFNPSTKKENLLTGFTSCIYFSEKQNLLCVAIRNLGLFVKQDKQQFFLQINEQNKWLKNITQILDYDNGLLLVINNVGIVYYEKGKPLKFLHALKQTFNKVQFIDSKLYCATPKGVFIVDLETGAQTTINKGSTGRGLTNSYCFDITLYNNLVWVATDGGGINILEPETGKVLENKFIKNLSSDAIRSFYVDDENRLWVGTYRGGVNICDPELSKFSFINKKKNKIESLQHNFVSSICVDNQNKLWIGTDGGGISVWDRKREIFTHYNSETNCPELQSNNITSIIKSENGDMYISTFRGGITKYNFKKKKFEIIPIKVQQIWTLHKDSEGNIWAGTVSQQGMFKIDTETDKITYYRELGTVSCIKDANNDQLIVSTKQHGLILFNKSGGIAEKYKITHPILNEERSIRDIIIIGNDAWLAMESIGLLKLNLVTKKLEKYSTEDGLCSNVIVSIYNDSNGLLWLGTTNGLSRFDPEKQIFSNFYKSDGLPSSHFGYQSSFFFNNILYMGTTNGIAWFTPKDVTEYNFNSQVVFTKFKIFNNEVVPNSIEDVEMESSINDVDKLVLPFDKAFFSFEYVLPEYSHASSIKYAYKLEGLDQNWSYVNHQTVASYTNVPSGTYKFRVKAGLNGIWKERDRVLTITILPAWWNTWWAYIIYITCFSVLLWIIIHIVKERSKLKNEINMASFAVEKEQELNEEKSQFFTNVSHELRTPLSLIYGGLEQELKHIENGHVKIKENVLKQVYNNSKRLLILVNQLINFRLSEKDVVKLKVSEGDLVKNLQTVFDSFQLKAKEKNINYIFSTNWKEINGWFDAEKFDVICYNLLSNAFKFTPKNGTIQLDLKCYGSQFELSVIDNGVGITSEEKSKIFERFYKADNQNNENTGSGIGLSLVKHYVNLHHGTIDVLSQSGNGANFCVKISIDGNSYKASEVDTRIGDYNTIYTKLLPVTKTIEQCINEPLVDTDYKPKLLIVDDNVELLEFMKSNFSKSYEVFTAENGALGYDMVKKHNPNLIISDVMMPHVDGLEFCQKVKSDIEESHIPLILLTAKVSAEARNEAMLVGANDFVTKPFSIDYLRLKIKNVLLNQKRISNFVKEQVVLQPEELELASLEKEFLRKVVETIENSITDSEFSVTTLSQEMGMSQSSFYKKIKGITGMTISDFVRNIKLKKAAQLILSGRYNISEAACEVGYSDLKHFRTNFKKQFGETPSAFLASKKNNRD